MTVVNKKQKLKSNRPIMNKKFLKFGITFCVLLHIELKT